MNAIKIPSKSFSRRLFAGLVILALLLSFMPVTPVRALKNFVVTSLDDTGDAVINGTCDDGTGECTLRAAIEEANSASNPGVDTISFDEAAISALLPTPSTIPTITVVNGVMVITEQLSINGAFKSTGIYLENGVGNAFEIQAGADGSEIRNLTLENFTGVGVLVQADSATLENLTINGSGLDGVQFDGVVGGTLQDSEIYGGGEDGVHVFGNSENVDITNTYIGVEDDSGAGIANGNANYGIYIEDSNGTSVSGCLIAANGMGGVMIEDTGGATTTGNSVSSTYIGVDATGDAGMPGGGNAGNGVTIDNAADTTIDGNIISNHVIGVQILGVNAAGTVVRDNHIGIDRVGENDIPNTSDGVQIVDGDNITVGPDNLISGNGGRGVVVLDGGSGSTDIIVTGNNIGLDIDGEFGHGNSADGVQFQGVTGGEISDNLISDNGGDGIEIRGASSGIVVAGNTIGADKNKVLAFGNAGNGVFINGWSTDNTVGGTSSGEGNYIIGNGDDGVHIEDNGTDSNRILGNSIHSNSDMGIDIVGAAGPDTNDAVPDGDSGPNQEQNYPVIHSATLDGTTLTMDVGLDSEVGTRYRLEFFHNTQCDASGYGEGRTVFHVVSEIYTETTTTPGQYRQTIVVSGVSFTDGYVSATATLNTVTGGLEDTSEFSECVFIQPASGSGVTDVFVVNSTGDGSDAAAGDGTCDVGGGICTLRAAIEEANALALAAGGAVDPILVTFETSQMGASAPYVITIGSSLTVDTPLIIEGPTSGSQPLVAVTDGIGGIHGFVIQSDDVSIDALAIYGFTGGSGVYADGVSDFELTNSYVGVENDGTTFNRNQIGVTLNATTNAILEDNVISGNFSDGIQVIGGSSGTDILGNYIGTTAAGTTALPNYGNGINLNNAIGTVIGGSGNGNVVSGNILNGIQVDGQSTGTTISYNKVGTGYNGAVIIGNGDSGVYIISSDQTTIFENIISNNGEDGVTVESFVFGGTTYGLENQITQNSMTSNGNLGIDLENDGITANDPAPDSDSGANNLQNYPDLVSAAPGSNYTVVEGTLTSAPGTYTVEFYTGTQGERYLNSISVSVPGGGTANFQAIIPEALPNGTLVTAIALQGKNTSEFAPAVGVSGTAPVVDTPQIEVQNTNDADGDGLFTTSELAVAPGALVPFRITIINTGNVDVTVDAASNDRYDAEMTTFCNTLVGTVIPAGDQVECNFTAAVSSTPLTIDTNTATIQVSDTYSQTVTDTGASSVTIPDNTPPVPPGPTPTSTSVPATLNFTILVDNDANHDNTYSNSETTTIDGDVVRFQVTITNSSTGALTVVSWSDTHYTVGGTCGDLVGQAIAAGSTRVCYFKNDINSGITSQTNTTTLTMRNSGGGQDSASDTSTVSYTTPTNTSSGGAVYYTATATGTSEFLTATVTETPTATVTETPTATEDILMIDTNTPTSTDEGIGGGADEETVWDTPTATEDIQATDAQATIDAQETLLAEAQAGDSGGGAGADTGADDAGGEEQEGGGVLGGFSPSMLLWCIVPAVLLLIVGGGMELVRWLNSRQV